MNSFVAGEAAAMTEAHRRFCRTAEKWRTLAERRRTAIVALYRNGGWRDLYTEERFMALLREAIATADTWARIAPSPAEELAALSEGNNPTVGSSYRTAA